MKKKPTTRETKCNPVDLLQMQLSRISSIRAEANNLHFFDV